jgi:hypothetical protein
VPRPHRHRPLADLLEGLGWARWSMWQATQRLHAVSVTDEVLLWDAVHEQGPRARAVRRAADRLRQAAEAMREAEWAALRRTLANDIVERHRQNGIRFDTEASRPWWSHLAKPSWPPTARRRLEARADGERQMARLWHINAAGFAAQVDNCTRAARLLATGVIDPVGEWAQMEAALPGLLQDAVAHDCLSAPGRTRRLAQEATAADHLRTWHWSWVWHIEQELRARAHLDAGSAPSAPERSDGRALNIQPSREPFPAPQEPGARGDGTT